MYLELSESEINLIVSALDSWLDEWGWAKAETATLKYKALIAKCTETEQLARKLGWKPRGEDESDQ